MLAYEWIASRARCCATGACRRGSNRETGLPVHCAFPDDYVTAHHLRDMLNQVSLAQLIAWRDEPGLLPRVPARQDRRRGWDELEGERLRLLARDRDEDVRFSAETELRRRWH